VSTTPQGSFLPIVDQLVVVHDTYDLERQFRSLSHVLYSRAVRWLSMQAASGVICVSEATLNDVRKLQNPNTSRFKVIKEASKYPPMRRDIDLTTRRSNGRFLFVANVERTKNVAVLLDALRLAERRQLPLQVEWIGRDSDNGVAEWIRVNGALTNFFPRGFVTNEELGEAYEMCIALIVPSFREGFCLPVLEAHSFGTPVIGSDIPILREVIGRGGIFFDPMNADALLQALCELSMNRNVLDSLRREAILNANSYSWHRAAEELEQFVEELRHA
jgi:glycosyltransferase involved in cell wall biosynthesis